MYPVTPKDKTYITVREVYPVCPELDKLGLSGKPHGNGNAWDIAPMQGYKNEVFYIVSPVFGEVIESGVAPERGNYICIKDNRAEHWFYHLQWRYVAKGQRVIKGTPIGIMGSTGKSTAKHVHWEVRNGLNIKEYAT